MRTTGRPLRRIARGTAAWSITALVASGCHGVPLARLAATPNRPQSINLASASRSAFLPATTVALDSPSEMASMESGANLGRVTPAPRAALVPTADHAVEPVADFLDRVDPSTSTSASPASTSTVAPESNAKPTPLLDKALIRARATTPAEDAPPIGPASPSASGSGSAEPRAADLPAGPGLTATSDAPLLVPAGSEPRPIAPPSAVVALAARGPSADRSEPPANAEPAEAAPSMTPDEAWRDGVRRLIGLARRNRDGEGSGQPSDAPWALRSKVLAWLAEPDIDPETGLTGTDSVRSVLHALELPAPVQGASAADPARASAAVGGEVRAAIQVLEARAPLELTDLQLCAKVEGFGAVVPFDQPDRRAGDWVIIYCEVEGMKHESTPDGYLTRLVGRMEILPEGGGPPMAFPLPPAEEVFPRRRRDYFVGYLKELPRDLPPGKHTLRLTIKDVLTDRWSDPRDVSFTIAREAPEMPAPR